MHAGLEENATDEQMLALLLDPNEPTPWRPLLEGGVDIGRLFGNRGGRRKETRALVWLERAQRLLLNETARVRAMINRIDPPDKAIPDLGTEFRSYLKGIEYTEGEVYNRAMRVSQLRAELFRLRAVERRSMPQKAGTEASEKPAHTLRAGAVAYLRFKTLEANHAAENGALDAGHVRLLCEAAQAGIPQAAQMLARFAENAENRREAYFWLTKLREFDDHGEDRAELDARILGHEQLLSEEDVAAIEETRERISAAVSRIMDAVSKTGRED